MNRLYIYIDRLNSQSFTATLKLYLVYHPGFVSEYTVHILLIYDMIYNHLHSKKTNTTCSIIPVSKPWLINIYVISPLIATVIPKFQMAETNSNTELRNWSAAACLELTVHTCASVGVQRYARTGFSWENEKKHTNGLHGNMGSCKWLY